jgi:hypothetical protein
MATGLLGAMAGHGAQVAALHTLGHIQAQGGEEGSLPAQEPVREGMLVLEEAAAGWISAALWPLS